MDRPSPQHWLKTRLTERLDRAARDVNVVLLVVAIGLAVLDATCFCAFLAGGALQSPAHASAQAPASTATAAAPGGQPPAH